MMKDMPSVLSDAFLAFSARIGADPLQIQGPGGNTSIKKSGVMWVKASGQELAQAQEKAIFVAVDQEKVKAIVRNNTGEEYQHTVLDGTLRPSIETSFHAVLDWSVVVHSHSIATLVHVISPQGCITAVEKLSHLEPVLVPYRKPGIPLTLAILERINSNTQVILLENHGLICCGDSVEATEALVQEVEKKLAMAILYSAENNTKAKPEPGYIWAQEESVLAQQKHCQRLVGEGSYYPDHVVFLGPRLPMVANESVPAFIVDGVGIQIKQNATAVQHAMLKCLADIFCRHPVDWQPKAISMDAESELLDWDAEKYRQALAKGGA